MRPDKIFVTPAPGKIVKDPATMEPLPEGGKLVPNISYYHRRAKDGDVVITLPKKPLEKAPDKEAKKAQTK